MPMADRWDPRQLRELAPQVLAATMRRYDDFAACEDAVQQALLAAAQQWPSAGVPEHPRAWLVHVASRRITDGVFPESKEFLVGYWIVDVDSPERAYAIAAEASAAPGKGGVPMNMSIEVRQVMSGPPDV